MTQRWRYECGSCGGISTVREQPPYPDEECVVCGAKGAWERKGRVPGPALNTPATVVGVFLILSAAVVSGAGYSLHLLDVPLTHRSLAFAAMVINGVGVAILSGAHLWLMWRRHRDRCEAELANGPGGDDAPF